MEIEILLHPNALVVNVFSNFLVSKKGLLREVDIHWWTVSDERVQIKQTKAAACV
jgi:hypothetical protein